MTDHITYNSPKKIPQSAKAYPSQVSPDTKVPSIEVSEKLQKVLARRGFGSRRTCEEMIEEGRVEVNGSVAIVGTRVNVESDKVKVDGEIVGIQPDLVYYLLNKPSGYICTVTDPQGRPTIIDLVPHDVRVFPVGRLDFSSEGLIIMTNDGDLTYLIAHPSHGVEKEYLVQLDRDISNRSIAKLRNGIELDDGLTAPAKVSRLAPSLVRITIHEGRNRQIRRMCEALGFRVVRLVRTRIGPIRDTRLGQGQWRNLYPEEIISLRNEASGRSRSSANGFKGR